MKDKMMICPKAKECLHSQFAGSFMHRHCGKHTKNKTCKVNREHFRDITCPACIPYEPEPVCPDCIIRKGFVEFRQAIRSALFPIWTNNPCVGDEEIINKVKEIVGCTPADLQPEKQLITESEHCYGCKKPNCKGCEYEPKKQCPECGHEIVRHSFVGCQVIPDERYQHTFCTCERSYESLLPQPPAPQMPLREQFKDVLDFQRHDKNQDRTLDLLESIATAHDSAIAAQAVRQCIAELEEKAYKSEAYKLKGNEGIVDELDRKAKRRAFNDGIMNCISIIRAMAEGKE